MVLYSSAKEYSHENAVLHVKLEVSNPDFTDISSKWYVNNYSFAIQYGLPCLYYVWYRDYNTGNCNAYHCITISCIIIYGYELLCITISCSNHQTRHTNTKKSWNMQQTDVHDFLVFAWLSRWSDQFKNSSVLPHCHLVVISRFMVRFEKPSCGLLQ